MTGGQSGATERHRGKAYRVPLIRPMSGFYTVVALVLRAILWSSTRKDWHGQDKLPKTGGFIAVSNHVTYADPITLAHFMNNSGHAPHFLAKSSLFTVPGLGWALRKLDQIPVYRGTSKAKDAVDKGLEVLRDGGAIALFPEGTLTRDPGLWPMEARTGAARMALDAGVPVIPIAQWGAHKLIPHYGKTFHPIPRKMVTMVAGDPIDLDDLRGKPLDNEVLREASDRIIDTLTLMLEEIRGEKAPEVRFSMRKKDS